MKTFWMSFVDNEKPKGQQFLGVSVIPVSAEEAESVKPLLDLRFPHHTPGAEWQAAATHKAHRLGCNPGGEVAFVEIDADATPFKDVPRGVLMQKDELKRRDLI